MERNRRAGLASALAVSVFPGLTVLAFSAANQEALPPDQSSAARPVFEAAQRYMDCKSRRPMAASCGSEWRKLAAAGESVQGTAFPMAKLVEASCRSVAAITDNAVAQREADVEEAARDYLMCRSRGLLGASRCAEELARLGQAVEKKKGFYDGCKVQWPSGEACAIQLMTWSIAHAVCVPLAAMQGGVSSMENSLAACGASAVPALRQPVLPADPNFVPDSPSSPSVPRSKASKPRPEAEPSNSSPANEESSGACSPGWYPHGTGCCRKGTKFCVY